MNKTFSIICINSMFSITLSSLYAQTAAAIPCSIKSSMSSPSTGSMLPTISWCSTHENYSECTNINNQSPSTTIMQMP
jgi:hypothetical protein